MEQKVYQYGYSVINGCLEPNIAICQKIDGKEIWIKQHNNQEHKY